MDRTKILKGPAKIEYGAETFYSRGDVTVTFSSPLFDKSTAAYGRHGQGVSDKRITVAFTPVTYTAAQAAVLVPYGSTAPGSSIYGATDAPLTVTPTNGQPLTVANAAPTGLPGMRFSAIQALWSGDVTFTGIIANNGDPSDTASYYSWGADAAGVDIGAGWDPAADIYLPYTGTYKSSGYEAKEGFAVEWNLELAEHKPDNSGTVDMHLTSHGATLTFQPSGNAEADIESLLNFGVRIGAGQTPGDFEIAGPNTGDLKFTLKSATPGPENARLYGAESDRIGELTFMAQRTVTAGAIDALYEFAAVI